MLLVIVRLIFGAAILYIGAEFLIRSAVRIAKFFRLPRIVIGLTVVAFATSLPEVLTSVFGQIYGKTGDIALGNVLGSNITNIALVLGVYTIIRPCKVTYSLRWRWMPTLFFVYLLIFLVMLGGTIHYLEGIFLLIALSLYIFLQYYLPPKREELKEEIEILGGKDRKSKRLALAVLAMIAGVVLLVFGTNFLIEGAVDLATMLGISERVIALSLVALGTSLPELATAIVAAFRKEEEVLVGTIVGSNIFNPLLIIPCATFVKPILFTRKMITIDFPVMVGVTLLLWALMFLGKDRLSRLDGTILLVSYGAYLTYLMT